MTNEHITDERAAFEAWYREHHGSRVSFSQYDTGTFKGDYREALVDGAWNVWQASRAALRPAAQPASAPAGPADVLGALEKRNIFDAIRCAYDLGYNDARNARAVPGDSAPGYDGKNVEADHGGALFNTMNRRLSESRPALRPAAQPVGEPVAWEIFCDRSYFDQWAVRRIGCKDFNKVFHVPSQKEASRLCALLNDTPHPSPERVPMTEFQRGTAVIHYLGPEALAGGKLSLLDVFHIGITAAEAHHGITTPKADK